MLQDPDGLWQQSGCRSPAPHGNFNLNSLSCMACLKQGHKVEKSGSWGTLKQSLDVTAASPADRPRQAPAEYILIVNRSLVSLSTRRYCQLRSQDNERGLLWVKRSFMFSNIIGKPENGCAGTAKTSPDVLLAPFLPTISQSHCIAASCQTICQLNSQAGTAKRYNAFVDAKNPFHSACCIEGNAQKAA